VEGVLRALPAILAVYPEVRYVVIGRGDDQPRLEQLAADLGIREQVIFAGFVPDDELVAHYQLADAYLMPSIEGFGIAYLEAMACGVPVVAGNDDGSADPLQDGQLGWQVTPQDAEAIAQATLAILAGSDRRSQGDWLRAETLKFYAQENLPTILADLIP
jgi:glycosyltransferase involved in cell wall biosynthesis